MSCIGVYHPQTRGLVDHASESDACMHMPPPLVLMPGLLHPTFQQLHCSQTLQRLTCFSALTYLHKCGSCRTQTCRHNADMQQARHHRS